MSAGAKTRPVVDLTICPSCSDKLVYPVRWRDLSHRGWWMELHCPNCDHLYELVVEHEVVEEFDRALNAGTDQVVEACDRLGAENMLEWATGFAVGLRAGAILPCDFGWSA